MTCSNHIRQLALAVQNFHDTYQRFPCFCNDEIFAVKNMDRVSFLAALLPFIEQAPLYEDLIGRASTTTVMTGYNTAATANVAKIEYFLCPSDGNADSWYSGDDTIVSYRGCMGDLVHQAGDNRRAVSTRSWLRQGAKSSTGASIDKGGPIGMEAVSDGTSNVIMFSEAVIWDRTAGNKPNADYKANLAGSTYLIFDQKPNDCLAKKGANGTLNCNTNNNKFSDARQGWRAMDCYSTFGNAFFSVLPPNSPSCIGTSGDDMWGGSSASSRHSGGVQIALHDASVRFISDTISVKNMDVACTKPNGNFPPDYPIAKNASGDGTIAINQEFSYGVWAELGVINDGHANAVP